MRETIESLLKRRPFEPFEIRMSNGDSVLVKHPESVVMMKTQVLVVYPEDDRFVFCALLHIADVQRPMQAA